MTPALRSLAFLFVMLCLATPARAQEDDDPAPDQPAAPAAADDDKPDEPAAPAAADDDPAPDQPAAPAAADDDKPDEAPAPAPAAGDADGDGTPDAVDKDDDNDGIPDDQEAPAPAPAPAAGDADGDGTPDAADKDDDNDGTPDDQEAPAADGDDDNIVDADADGDGTADSMDKDDDNDGVDDAAEDDAQDVAVQEDEDGEPYIEADYDGDGVVEADELVQEQEYDEAYAGIPDQIDDAALEARPENNELGASLTIEHFRKLVRLAKRKVLERLEAKIERKAEQRMATISMLIFFFSLAGFLLLAMPLVLGKKYPGQTGNLFKYSALAAVTFIVTVNLFGVIMLGMRTTQGALGKQTNPQLKIAAGTFDTLDQNAARYLVTGKELFAPTLESLDGKSDEQPMVLLLENGQKIVKKASVFKSIASMFKQVNFIFGILPIVLLGVTMLLFILAIKPTLIEIIKLPATAASGAANAGRDVVRRALRRVGGEVVATVCTLGVLIVLSLLSGFVMGQVVTPVLDTLITCFARAVDYLQFVEGASTGQVAVMLFSVILFLLLNLAAVILSMSFFLGKTQKIFQQRFNEGVPLAAHARWWKWAIPSVLIAQLVPLLYLFLARFGVEAIERRIMAASTDAEKVNWTMLMLSTPLFLVIGFLVVFWAARGLASVTFLAKYKVKLAPAKPAPSPYGSPAA